MSENYKTTKYFYMDGTDSTIPDPKAIHNDDTLIMIEEYTHNILTSCITVKKPDNINESLLLLQYRRVYQTWHDGPTFDPDIQHYYGDFKQKDTGNFLEIPYTVYSDYSGSTVERSNCRSLKRFIEGLELPVWELPGGYGTNGLIIRYVDLLRSEELQEVISKLFDYPIYDEDDWRTLELEIEQEDWDSWIKYDFIKTLIDQGVYSDEGLEALEDDQIIAMYQKAREESGTEWYTESAVSGYIDIDKLVNYIKTHKE